MPRTAITPQRLDSPGGEDVTFVTCDVANGMKVANDGRTILLVNSASASGITVTVPSVTCSHGRTGDKVKAVGASLIEAMGPYSPVENWGDGVGTLNLDFSVQSGTTTIAAVQV